MSWRKTLGSRDGFLVEMMPEPIGCMCVHTRVYLCGHVERDWMRLRPREGRSSNDRR